MAARTRRIAHDANTRAKIQASQLINRLTKHVHGEIELSPTQIQAARILLDKSLPNLQAIDMDIDGGIEMHNTVSAKPMDVEEWRKQFSE